MAKSATSLPFAPRGVKKLAKPAPAMLKRMKGQRTKLKSTTSRSGMRKANSMKGYKSG